jgi:microcystin-dependent protein
MSDPYLGQISLFSFGFAPKGWALCNGQTLPINQNQALFSLLGTTYGGNGVTTFALPNLQGRASISSGQGPGLSNYALGQNGGEVGHTLTTQEIPAHTHSAATATNTTQMSPQGNYPAANTDQNATYSAASSGTMAASAVGFGGNNQPHQNMQPYLAVNFCIALVGIFPSRN